MLYRPKTSSLLIINTLENEIIAKQFILSIKGKLLISSIVRYRIIGRHSTTIFDELGSSITGGMPNSHPTE